MISIELHREMLSRAIEQSIASLKRREKTEYNPMVIKIVQDEIAMYQNALNTMRDGGDNSPKVVQK